MAQAKLVSGLFPSPALILGNAQIPKDRSSTDLQLLTHWERVQQEGGRRHWSRRYPQEAPLWERLDESQYLWGTRISRDCLDEPWADYRVRAPKSGLAHQRLPQALILDHTTLKPSLAMPANSLLEILPLEPAGLPSAKLCLSKPSPFLPCCLLSHPIQDSSVTTSPTPSKLRVSRTLQMTHSLKCHCLGKDAPALPTELSEFYSVQKNKCSTQVCCSELT